MRIDHLSRLPVMMSTGCKSSHNGFLDVSRSNGGLSISGWIGQLSCLTIFSTGLSVAAFLRRAGGSMLESTGSHGRGVERRVPEMRWSVRVRRTTGVYIGHEEYRHPLRKSVSQVCQYRLKEKITDGVVRSRFHVRLLKSFITGR